MSKLSFNEKTALTLIAVLGVLGFVWAYLHAGGGASDLEKVVDLSYRPTTSPHEPSIVPVDDKVLHYCPPDKLNRTVKSRHSYPDHSGMNITMLIHRGFSAISLPTAGGNQGWFNCPPNNEQAPL